MSADIAEARKTLREERLRMTALLEEMGSCTNPKLKPVYMRKVDDCLDKLRAARRVLEGCGEWREP